jgi:hypothetical protein
MCPTDTLLFTETIVLNPLHTSSLFCSQNWRKATGFLLRSVLYMGTPPAGGLSQESRYLSRHFYLQTAEKDMQWVHYIPSGPHTNRL